MSVLKRNDATIVIEEDNSVGNSLRFSSYDEQTLYVEIDNPWSADTESGFGSDAHFTISKDDAAAVAKFLAKWSRQCPPSHHSVGASARARRICEQSAKEQEGEK